MAQDWLTEQQQLLLRELRLLDPEPVFRGFPDLALPEDPVPSPHLNNELLFEVDYDAEHAALRERLLGYRRRSEQVYKVGELVREYEGKFRSLMEEKERLVGLLGEMKGSTGELVEKQKRMIDLSMKMKESLDYYAYHEKFKWEFPCEVGCREMFEQLLQPTLSELADGLHFFQENSTFAGSRRSVGLFQASRSKVLSFVKSFFIKLFSKESQFGSRNLKLPLSSCVDSFYPKSKMKLVTAFLLQFPQFHPHLAPLLHQLKESATDDEVRFLEIKELEIEEFQLNPANLALIAYLQRHVPEVYEEAVLKFFTYYRSNAHLSALKALPRDGNFTSLFRERLVLAAYLLSCELAYLNYCCRASPDTADLLRSTLSSIARAHTDELSKLLKDPRNKSPFEVCEAIEKVREEYPLFLDCHLREEYQSYAFGCVSQFVALPEHTDFLKSTVEAMARRLQAELEGMCFNCLPKAAMSSARGEVEAQVRAVAEGIPRLRFCAAQAEKYLIATLDTLVRSIKEVNARTESRFECYLWNIEMFGAIRGALRGVRGSLVRRELKLEVNQSAGLIDRVKNVERSESLLKYAQDLFQVIRTGMPVISELTLDFSKFIHQHCQALESQFVKDILFIYAKNMIEFLHRLAEAQPQQGAELCTPLAVQTLYSLYLLSLEKYVKEAGALFKERESYKLGEESSELVVGLLN